MKKFNSSWRNGYKNRQALNGFFPLDEEQVCHRKQEMVSILEFIVGKIKNKLGGGGIG